MKKTRFELRISEELIKDIKIQALKYGISASDFIVFGILESIALNNLDYLITEPLVDEIEKLKEKYLYL